jgi:triosephosphate isomerase (TIM)
MARPIIMGNWKMNLTAKDAVKLASEVDELTKDADAEIILFPPATALGSVSEALDKSHIKLGAQNMHPEKEGRFTGEISGKMIKEFAKYVLIGHSERRILFNEDNEFINKKVRSALEHGLTPVLCVGEEREDRESKNTKKVLEHQLTLCLKGVQKDKATKVIIAYEPVWAIGATIATVAEIDEASAFIRYVLDKLYDDETAKKMKIVYGGSVKHENVGSFIHKDLVEGALVGGASLDAKEFSAICNFKKEE